MSVRQKYKGSAKKIKIKSNYPNRRVAIKSTGRIRIRKA